jgi:hypothetical protein
MPTQSPAQTTQDTSPTHRYWLSILIRPLIPSRDCAQSTPCSNRAWPSRSGVALRCLDLLLLFRLALGGHFRFRSRGGLRCFGGESFLFFGEDAGGFLLAGKVGEPFLFFGGVFTVFWDGREGFVGWSKRLWTERKV